MRRYIDANKAKIKYSSKDVDNITNLFNELIDSQPTVDAVEVVRCKDCKYCTDYSIDIEIGTIPYFACEIGKFIENVELEHYCGYGKRRE